MRGGRAIDINQAVILAGGQGRRLRPYTDRVPKALVRVAGQPILDHQLAWLAAHGVTDAVVVCGHLGHLIEDHIRSRPLPLAVTCVRETAPLGRGGAMRFGAAVRARSDEGWYGLNGDLITSFPLRGLSRAHSESGLLITIAVARPSLPWGVVRVDVTGRVREFVEAAPSPDFVNGGVYAFSPTALDHLPTTGDLERTTFPELAAAGRLGSHPVAGYWRPIDTEKDLMEAARELTG
jgi:NDP-sugar pyrophosphorylase family protein